MCRHLEERQEIMYDMILVDQLEYENENEL